VTYQGKMYDLIEIHILHTAPLKV